MAEFRFPSQVLKIKKEESWTTTEATLQELCSSYWNQAAQIIRTRQPIYKKMDDHLKNSPVHLFNTVNHSVNDDLIEIFNQTEWRELNQALVCNIFWSDATIEESSIQVVKVLQMWDYSLKKINNEKLYANSISQAKNIQELYQWIGTTFYDWMNSLDDIEKMGELFFREISLPNNKLNYEK